MALSDNKLKIQELIDTINALPGAGGGGGGLPSGITALAAGTFTPTVDISAYSYMPIQVWHNMGVTPNYIVVMDTSDYSETYAENTLVAATMEAKPYKENDPYSIYCPEWTYKYYRTEGCVDWCTMNYEYGDDYSWDINDVFFNIYGANGQDYGDIKAAHTYRWVAAVIDGFN